MDEKLSTQQTQELQDCLAVAGINPARICNLIMLYNMAIPFLTMFGVTLPPMPLPSFCTTPAPTPTPTPAS